MPLKQSEIYGGNSVESAAKIFQVFSMAMVLLKTVWLVQMLP